MSDQHADAIGDVGHSWLAAVSFVETADSLMTLAKLPRVSFLHGRDHEIQRQIKPTSVSGARYTQEKRR
jgi:hypothetical protein